MHRWDDKALFRISWPFNETINRFEFINDTFSVVFNKEEAYDTGATIRDNHDCISNVNVFAYQFNGKQTAMSLYENEKANMPAIYPASPQRDDDLSTYIYSHFPITENSVSYVYDFVIENLPTSIVNDDFVIKLSDVWGYTVEGNSEADANQLNSIKIYPNPTTNQVTIQTDENDNIINIELYNILGKYLKTIHTNSSKEILNLNYFASGLYFLKIESKNNTNTFKVIKK